LVVFVSKSIVEYHHKVPWSMIEKYHGIPSAICIMCE